MIKNSNKKIKVALLVFTLAFPALILAKSFVPQKILGFFGKSKGTNNESTDNSKLAETEYCDPVQEEEDDEYLFIGCNGFF